MPKAKRSRAECEKIVEAYKYANSKADAARNLNMAFTSFKSVLAAIPRWYPDLIIPHKNRTPAAHGRIEIEVENGIGLVGGDAHYWPGYPPSTAHRAFIFFAKQMKKELAFVCVNGDALDFPRTSRHPPLGWTRMPETKDEIEEAQARLQEIADAAGKVRRFWPGGNHDYRFEMYLAANAPEIANVHGTRLKDHFPLWENCDSLFVNNRPGGVVIKHRWKGGIHATWNNAVNAGRHIITNHLHSQRVTPVTDYNGTRYGVDTGCLCDPWGEQFAYLEDNPRNWRSGFAVLTWVDGDLMPPELVTVIEEGVVSFRGKLWEV